MKHPVKVAAGVFLSISLILAVPAPTEYTHEMFVEDLQLSSLVAMCEIVSFDTLADADGGINDTLKTVIRIKESYKGGIDSQDSLYNAYRNIGVVGGYAPNYQEGDQAIICFREGSGFIDSNGKKSLSVHARGTFVVKEDSVLPPPVGLGFADDLKSYASDPERFANRIRSTVAINEMVEYSPVIPLVDDIVKVKSYIELMGGAEVGDVSLEVDGKNIDLTIPYMPCTSEICPELYELDTVEAEAGSLAEGSYTLNSYELNLYTGVHTLVSSLDFSVYEDKTRIRERVYPTSQVSSFGDNSGGILYDLQGRRVQVIRKGIEGNSIKPDIKSNGGLRNGIYILRNPDAGVSRRVLIRE